MELVKVGNTVITVGQFAERLADQSPYLRARYQSSERRREFLENMIDFELLAVEAKRRGYDTRPEVEYERKQKMVQMMMRQLFAERGGKMSSVSDGDIKAYYDQHKDEFRKPRQVRASHILFKEKDRNTAQTVLKRLLSEPENMQRLTKW